MAFSPRYTESPLRQTATWSGDRTNITRRTASVPSPRVFDSVRANRGSPAQLEETDVIRSARSNLRMEEESIIGRKAEYFPASTSFARARQTTDSTFLHQTSTPKLVRTTGIYFSQEFEEIEDILEQRMRIAQDTTRALINAQDSLHAESILQTARADVTPTRGPPTYHGSGGATALNVVQASVAEHNDIRAQIRGCMTDLQMVEMASGGGTADVISMCQADMERLAHLRAVIELSMEKLSIQMTDLREQTREATQRAETAEMQARTMQGQMQEHAATVTALDDQLRAALERSDQAQREASERLDRELNEQSARLAQQASQNCDAALRNLEARIQAEHAHSIAALQAELDHLHARRLDEALGDQHHQLTAAFALEKAEALHELQSSLQRAEEENLEHLRAQMISERERIVQVRAHCVVLVFVLGWCGRVVLVFVLVLVLVFVLVVVVVLVLLFLGLISSTHSRQCSASRQPSRSGQPNRLSG
eukprot:m.170984 g.170984  ORF g.170984 m.170984 type:complete len:482 (-) comp9931_c0_seq25:1504-2949(-)